MHIVVFLNKKAGAMATPGESSEFTPERLEDAFTKAGIHAEIHVLDPATTEKMVRAALGAQPRPGVIVVGGGDGTVSSVAGLLADSGVPMGVLPVGTLNHFAKDLGIPADLENWLALLVSRHIRKVDVGEVNGRVFINNCSIGAYPEAVRRREQLRRTAGHGKWWAMSVATLEVMRRVRRLRVQIQVDDQSFSRRTPFVVIGCNRYTGHLFSASLRARMDEGRLWLYTTRADRFLPLLRLAFRALVGRIDRADDFESRSGQRIKLMVQGGEVAVAADGEVWRLRLPLELRIRTGALLVIAPPPPVVT